jgi:DNA-binding SARP family transcriptional activator
LVLIGGWRLTQGGRAIHLSPSAQRLLAFIALKDHANRPFAAGTLWPEVTEERAQGSLRTTLWRIWRACPGLLEDDSSVLALAPGTAVDVWQLLTLNRSLAADATADLSAVWPLLASRSELLPGWYVDCVLM